MINIKHIKWSVVILLLGIMLAGYGGLCSKKKSSSGSSGTPPQSFMGPGNPAPDATNVSITAQLIWPVAIGATSYDVHFGTDAQPPFVANVITTTYNPGILSYNTTYSWMVNPKNSFGTSPGTGVCSFQTTSSGVTTTPATNITTTSATLNGTVNPKGLTTTVYFDYGLNTSYGITTTTQAIGNVTSDVNVTVDLSGLISDTTYNFRIVATNSNGIIYGANKTFRTTDFVLLAPLNNNITTLQPIFSWSPYPSDLTSYTLQISTDINFGTYTFTRTNIAPYVTSYPSGIGTYPIPLDQNTDYYWRIIAVDSNFGIQTRASNAPFKFTTGIVPGTFTLLSPSNNATGIGTTPTLTWTAASQALNYVVQIDTKTTFNNPLAYDTSSDEQLLSIPTTSHTIPPGILSGGIRYYWRVIAQNTGGGTIAPSGTTGYWSFVTQ